MASSEEQRSEEPAKECILHRTKTVQFFGRSTPIILQNDNGPCPLLAICNVLLLKNQLNLNPDISEVSQEKLLSLVADRLIDSNSNVKNKDSGYVENQQQNIADAIDLLPRLTTGIDVNIKFRRIDDFEFTRECAIFDLLDIPLYHGWLVDPQDHETAEAIGSKSYNTIMSDLVSLETWKMKDEGKNKADEDCIDFAAATAATLGVPSPSLSQAKSFDDSPRYVSDHQKILRKGDTEEEAELQRVSELSNNERPHVEDVPGAAATSGGDSMIDSDKIVCLSKTTPEKPLNVAEDYNLNGSLDVEPSVSGRGDVPGDCNGNVQSQEEKAGSLNSTNGGEGKSDQLAADPSTEGFLSNDLARYHVGTMLDEPPSSSPLAQDTVQNQAAEDELHRQNSEESSTVLVGNGDSQSSSGRIPNIEAIDSFKSSFDGSEPIYEGEECIQDSRTVCEEGEPVYEGEVVLAEQADKGTKDICNAMPKDEITLRQGELISNFLKSNMSQLTFYGLFSLQEGLKERELCVFFRNNHFSTMFKFEGELYLLATDQGFMNQPDLVWEKLNQVNGDTLFMTCNFKEFSLESSTNGVWDQQNAVATTADYLASINSSAHASSNMNSDLQLAIALQQQELEQQPQRHAPQQPPSNGSSRLIVGPQVPRSSSKATSSSVRQEQKSKDKSSNCKLM